MNRRLVKLGLALGLAAGLSGCARQVTLAPPAERGAFSLAEGGRADTSALVFNTPSVRIANAVPDEALLAYGRNDARLSPFTPRPLRAVDQWPERPAPVLEWQRPVRISDNPRYFYLPGDPTLRGGYGGPAYRQPARPMPSFVR